MSFTKTTLSHDNYLTLTPTRVFLKDECKLTGDGCVSSPVFIVIERLNI